jgi:hypothetical protein
MSEGKTLVRVLAGMRGRDMMMTVEIGVEASHVANGTLLTAWPLQTKWRQAYKPQLIGEQLLWMSRGLTFV